MKMFDGVNARLCIDQYGRQVWATTLKELREKSGSGSAPVEQYCDMVGGEHAGHTVQTGYVIGPFWFTIYAPVQVRQ